MTLDIQVPPLTTSTPGCRAPLPACSLPFELNVRPLHRALAASTAPSSRRTRRTTLKAPAHPSLATSWTAGWPRPFPTPTRSPPRALRTPATSPAALQCPPPLPPDSHNVVVQTCDLSNPDAPCTITGNNYEDMVSIGRLGPVPVTFGAITSQVLATQPHGCAWWWPRGWWCYWCCGCGWWCQSAATTERLNGPWSRGFGCAGSGHVLGGALAAAALAHSLRLKSSSDLEFRPVQADRRRGRPRGWGG